MIYSLTVTNTIGESLTFELSKPWASGYAIKTIDGVGTPDMNVNTTPYGIGDGSVLGSIKAEYRLITIILYPLAKPTVETTRQKLYRYFQMKKEVILTFNTEHRLVTISGYVQNINPDIFTNPETITIEIKCVDPYFHKMVVDQTKFYGINPMFEFPFSVEFEFTDDYAWKESSRSVDLLLNGVIYGSDKFVAVGRDDNSPFAYSIDGFNWEKIPFIVGEDAYWSDIAYGNGIYISVFSNGNIGAYSTDGIEWELINLSVNAEWKKVIFGNDRFVALAKNGTNGAYSFNGKDWYPMNYEIDGDWFKLIYLRHRLI